MEWSISKKVMQTCTRYILIIRSFSGNIKITNILKHASETNRALNISNWEEPTCLGGDISSKNLYAGALQAFGKTNNFLMCSILQTVLGYRKAIFIT